MICIQAPQENFDPDLRSDDCREAVEQTLHSLIAEAETKGWQREEIAMALADVVEDYICLLAQKRIARH